MRSSKSMFVLSSSLRKEGWYVLNWSYPSREKCIEEHAEELLKKLKALSLRYPGKPISFVTHSLGGVIVRCALNHPNCPQEAKIGRAVLIAPPNRGTRFARYLYKYKMMRAILGKNAGRQLMTFPPDRFDDFGHFPEDMSVLVISGVRGFNPIIPDVNDGKLGFKETCLKTPHYHEITHSGHTWICFKSDVIKKTKKFLSAYETGTILEDR